MTFVVIALSVTESVLEKWVSYVFRAVLHERDYHLTLAGLSVFKTPVMASGIVPWG
ncbi:hypothetical protein IAD21_00995 [Abditibacteriota bacterium]|nr:hypothetical protein IAD21_00995 [Abditibacteriota bacterium]